MTEQEQQTLVQWLDEATRRAEKAERERDEARRDARRWETVVARWGRHDADCRKVVVTPAAYQNNYVPPPCDCGYDAAISARTPGGEG